MSGSFEMHREKLDTLVAGINARYVVQVGIFGSRNARHTKGSALTNSELGAIHEFGSFSRHIPPRSFLRMPIFQKTKEIGARAMKGAQELLAKGEMIKVMQRLGVSAENAVQQAFASRGFGQWKEDRASTIRRKHSSAPLIDTAQLRRSIDSRVVKL